MRLTRVVFCPNQIATVIALGISKRDAESNSTIVIYWPERCNIAALRASDITCIPYSRMACVLILIRHGITGVLESCVPHRKLGRFINFFSTLCSTQSLVDDGLDSFREVPKNVDPEFFSEKTHFYTFEYTFPLAGWVSKFKVVGVASLHSLAITECPVLDTAPFKRIVIESPPLSRITEALHLDSTDTKLIVHSNPSKRQISTYGHATIIGSSIALEASLDHFSGEVIVGESMVAVYLLRQAHANYKIVVWISSDERDNLRSLVSLVKTRSYCSLKFC